MKWSDIGQGIVVADSPVPDILPDTAKTNPAFYKSAMQLYLKAGVKIFRAGTDEGIRLCKELLPKGGQVWGRVESSGKILALKEIEATILGEHFERKVSELAAAMPDAIIIQSISDVEEGVNALRSAKKACNLKIGVSMVFGSGAERADTVMGQPCEDVTRQLVDEGADFVGCNCGISVDEMVLVVRLMREVTALPILACPDAGQRELDGDEIVYRETPDDFASKSCSLVSAGANIIGGCCGVTPAHLEALVDALAAD